jgi:hypothetical protein
VFPVRYEHHLHIKSKAISVTDREGPQVRRCRGSHIVILKDDCEVVGLTRLPHFSVNLLYLKKEKQLKILRQTEISALKRALKTTHQWVYMEDEDGMFAGPPSGGELQRRLQE